MMHESALGSMRVHIDHESALGCMSVHLEHESALGPQAKNKSTAGQLDYV